MCRQWRRRQRQQRRIECWMLLRKHDSKPIEMFDRNSPDDKLKFLLRWRPHGFKPNGLSHSYTATATAVIFSDVKIAIQSSGENGNKNANNGISDLVFGDASKDTPLWKYGILKSMAWARALQKIKNEWEKRVIDGERKTYELLKCRIGIHEENWGVHLSSSNKSA